ncbi:complex I subunit 5 family protein [Dethiobacter alkaliphilus]|uniref:NADH dehydrogenase (Quinone) n=1 Tax=Dethiobacter alkaliphilus AHT 1 TaxID=555088 RepID=C0GEX1_DETAL|nr:monovalent cation/H+ antiporter subunit D family protein [Dethiobacter alkaliphilus]EEG78153.1 NADH dehydrogenase (quinone) [Dethiobacter alkaliphilus AHT 1]
MSLTQHFPALIVVVPLFFAYLAPVFSRWRKNWVAPATLSALVFMLLASLYMVWQVMTTGPFTYEMGNWPPPWGIELTVDYLAAFASATLSALGLIILFYGTKDLLHELKEGVVGWYYTLYLLLMASMLGMVLTNDLFNLFVFVEICAIASCGIISIKESRECIEAAFKYLVLSAVGSGCILLAIAMIYMVTGHLNFVFVSGALQEAMYLYPYNLLAALALLLTGLGVKAALFPLHVWLPDAHSSAPSPSSAVLSGLVIKVYAIVMIKLLYKVFPAEMLGMVPVMEILLWMSTLAIVIGSMFAIVQDDIKKMLAYSSIAQIGYVFLGVALMSETALTGGILHILNHAIMKAMLFLSAGAFIYCTGTRKLSQLKGIGHTMLIPTVAFSIGAFAMVGIPITNGFISKWYLALGSLDIGRPFFAAVILISSLLNGIYYLPIIVNAFFGEPEGRVAEPKKLPLQMSAPLVLLAFGVIWFGVFPSTVLGVVTRAAQSLLGLL